MDDMHDYARKVREISDALGAEDDSDSEIDEIKSLLDRAADMLETRGSALFP